MVLLSALLMVPGLRFWLKGKAKPIRGGAHSLAQNATCPCATAAILLVNGMMLQYFWLLGESYTIINLYVSNTFWFLTRLLLLDARLNIYVQNAHS